MTDQPEEPEETVVERFRPTSGRLSGYLGLLCAAVVLVLAILGWGSGPALGVAILACLGAVLVWAALLRPALWVTERHLVMRNMFHTDRLPLGAIGRVAVAQVLAVSANDKRYVSPVIGQSLRQSMQARGAAPSGSAKAPSPLTSYPLFVEERIAHLAREHRERHGEAAEPVRRTYAWPELVALAVGVVAFLLWVAFR